MQRDLPAALVVTATYLGIKGTRAQQAVPAEYVSGGRGESLPLLPVGYTYLTSNGNSTRESGQIQLRRRLHNGLTATAQYTYSQVDRRRGAGRPRAGWRSVIAQDWLDLSAERGLSNFDQRHLLTLQTQYTTGMGVKGGALLSGWRGAAFKEWTLITQDHRRQRAAADADLSVAGGGDRRDRAAPAGLHGRAACNRLRRASPESGGVRRAAAGTVGQRRAGTRSPDRRSSS